MSAVSLHPGKKLKANYQTLLAKYVLAQFGPLPKSLSQAWERDLEDFGSPPPKMGGGAGGGGETGYLRNSLTASVDRGQRSTAT